MWKPTREDRDPRRAGPSEFLVLVFSLSLCAALDLRAFVLVLVVSISDFAISRRLADAGGEAKRSALLLMSVTVDTGLLLAWRVAAIVAEVPSLVPHGSVLGRDGIDVVIPVGLSFLVLRSMSFVIDVSRGATEPCQSWIRYAAFLSFFPTFLAGPLARGSQLIPQLRRGVHITGNSCLEGSSILVQGLAKKLLIADRLGTIADPVFLSPQVYSPVSTAIGVLAYSLQVYCDFSGYSDMAIGAARVLGFDVPRNFEMPYLAKNIAEFWHRWHITLSLWLRDYVFLPTAYAGSRLVETLGLGRRRGELVNYGAASILTMLVAGVWHGHGWGFVVWGGIHGVGLAANRVWQSARKGGRPMWPWLARFLTFSFVAVSWIPFRAGSMGKTLVVFERLLGLGSQRVYTWLPSWLPVCLGVVVLSHLVGYALRTDEDPETREWSQKWLALFGLEVSTGPLSGAYLVPRRVTALGTYLVVLLVLSILLFMPPRVGPFIYAGF